MYIFIFSYQRRFPHERNGIYSQMLPWEGGWGAIYARVRVWCVCVDVCVCVVFGVLLADGCGWSTNIRVQVGGLTCRCDRTCARVGICVVRLLGYTFSFVC